MIQLKEHNPELAVIYDIYQDQGDVDLPSPRKHSEIVPLARRLRLLLKRLAHSERFVTWAFLLVGVGGLLVGVGQFFGNIHRPYVLEPLVTPTVDLQSAVASEPDVLGLRTKDTDLDGVSDYDELNIYKTSPYLPDTDGDGATDNAELTKGTDPLCPIGRDCSLFSDLQTGQSLVVDESSAQGQALAGGGATATQLRELLTQSGLDPSALKGVSDEQLLNAYNQALSDPLTDPTTATTTASTTTVPSSIADLTPEQVRDLLHQNGVAESTINQYDDAALMELVNETLTETQ